MIQLMTSLVSLGQAYMDQGVIPDPETTTHAIYYTCEITDPILAFKLVTDHPLRAPRANLRSNSISCCNTYYETLQYVMGARELKDTPNWPETLSFQTWFSKFEAALRRANSTDVLAAFRAFLPVMQQYRLTPTRGPGFVQLHRQDESPPPLSGVPALKNLTTTTALHAGTPVIFTLGGVPLIDLPTIQQTWMADLQASRESSPDGWSLLTGKPCQVARVHQRGVAFKNSLVSYNKPNFEWGGFQQGHNFPTAPHESTLWSQALDVVINRGQSTNIPRGSTADDVISVHAGWWSLENVDHPLLAILGQLLRHWPLTNVVVHEAWAALEAVSDQDETPIQFLVWQASKGRFTLIERWTQTASQVRAALLQFRAEWGRECQPLRVLTASDFSSMATPVREVERNFQALLTGADLGPQLVRHLAAHQYRTPHADNWLRVVCLRNLKMAKKSLAHIPNVAATTYQNDATPPALDLDPVGLTGRNLLSYQYGLFCALCLRLEELYRTSKSRGQPVKLRATQPQNPRTFLNSTISKLVLWRNHNYGATNGPQSKILDTYLGTLSANMSPANLLRVQANNPMAAWGWQHGRAYTAELASFVSQLRAVEAEAQRPKTKKTA